MCGVLAPTTELASAGEDRRSPCSHDLRIRCVVETDEVAVSIRAVPDGELTRASSDLAPANIIGMVVTDACVMTNYRGYEDAFQVRLLDLASRNEVTLQLEAAAGALWMRRVI